MDHYTIHPFGPMHPAAFTLALMVFLTSCTRPAVRGPGYWQSIAKQELSERVRTPYDTVFEDVGFIKAIVKDRMDVYDVVNGRVEHFFRYERGENQGYEYEWSSDGAISYVSNYVDGELEGEAIEFNYERGQQIMRTYRNGALISTDSVPLTERPLIELFRPPELSAQR